MNIAYRSVATLICLFALAACNTAPPAPAVKTMEVNGARLTYADEGAATPSCSYTARWAATGCGILIARRSRPAGIGRSRTRSATSAPTLGATVGRSSASARTPTPRVIVVRGGDVRPFFRSVADAAGRCLPQGKAVAVPGQKHMWPAEDPAGFNAMVMSFLKSK